MALVPSPANGNYQDEEERGARAVFTAIRDRDLDARQRLPQEVKSDPDKAARARRAALFTGTSADAIERNMPEFEERQRIEAVSGAMSASERLRRWYSRGENVRVSHDDTEALRRTARPFEPDAITSSYQEAARSRTLANRAADGVFSRGLQFFKRGVGLFEGGLFTLGGALQEWSANTSIPFYSDETNARLREESLAKAAQLRARADAAFSGGEIAGETTWQQVKDRPTIGNVASFIGQQGIQSAPQMAAAAFALPGLIASQSGNIGQSRAENDGRDYAAMGDVLKAAPAAVASSLLDRLGVEAIFANAGKTALRRVAIAGGTEGATEFAQGMIESAGGSIGTDRGFDWRESLDEAVAGMVAGTGLGAGIRSAHETTRIAATRSIQYIQGRAGERLVDDIFKGAERSKLRLRDPELFAEFLAESAAGTAAENLYVSGDAIRSLYQDENGLEIERGEGAIDFEEFVPNFWDQFAQATATGGDVVIPMAKAAAYLAGTPEWELIKGEARVAAGGFSPNEARAMESDWASTVEDMGRRAYAAAQEDVEAAGPRRRVYDAVLSQARQAGFTLNASRAYADLWAERYQARAERLGTDADAWTLFEASVAGIRQAMPGTLETYRKGDGLDVLINAMREGAQGMKPEGQSLLDRIIEGGGVIDAGGDIRSMGGGAVKKGGYFGRQLKPLIREYDETGDMLGGGSNAEYGLDDWAMRLWEEGYFPHALDRPSVNDLLDLIGDALRGEDIYPQGAASPAVEANNEIVTAADDLRNVLFNAGLDPDTASREEIERAINAYQADEGVYGFDQDYAVDRDGVAGWRPERIRDLLRQYAVDFDPTKTKSYVARIDPNDFVESTTPEGEQAALREAAGEIDMERLAGETQTPFLEVKLLDEEKGDLFSIVGHEGRHRMAGLAAAGVQSVPVVITRRDIGWSDLEEVDFPFLGRQRYGSAGEGSKGILPRSIVPLNYANEARIREEFGAGSTLFQEPLLQATSEGKPLVTVHNLSADNLRNAEEIGGLAAPSIAVIRADIGFDNFGEITLIAKPDLIDPVKGKGARAFNADVYSPRQPRAQFDLHGPTLKKLRTDMAEVAADLGESFDSEFDPDKLSREGLAAIEGSPVARMAYLREAGKAPRVVRSKPDPVDPRLVKAAKGETDHYALRNDPAFLAVLRDVVEDEIAKVAEIEPDMVERLRSRWFDEDGEINYRMATDRAHAAIRANGPPPIDRWETRKAIDAKLAKPKDHAAFRRWVQDNYAGLIAGRFFEKRDSGRRQDYTMANLVREMTRTIRDGEGFNYGVGSLRSNVARQFRSLAAIQEDRGSIIADADMDKIKEEVSDEMFALGAKFAPLHGSGEDFGWMDIFTQFLKDLAVGRPADLREWQTEIFKEPAPDALIEEARAFLDKLRSLPTEYFEVKMQRAVGFDEFAAAVVPDDLDRETVDRLKSYGLKVETYPKGQSRSDAIMRAGGGVRALFQLAAPALPETIEIDGRPRATRNSAGYPIARDEAGVRAFWAWFGDSKVVDDQGRPLVVYHGTASEFDAFSKKADAKHIDLPGFFFTPDPAIAQRFADSASRKPFRDKDGYIEGFEGASIVPTYLSIQSPDEIALDDAETGRMSNASRVRSLIEKAGQEGHDGAVVRGWTDGSGETQWVAFSPTQIKSINNRGTFDPADARMLFQPAYHGSPHTFDRFSTDFMGTGEGAQAFGWGLYFSGSREIADWYREKLATGDDNYIVAGTDEVFNPDRLSHPNIRVAARKNGTDVEATIRRVRQLLADANETTRPMLEEDLAVLSEIEERGGLKPPGRGRLYEVDIPEDSEFFLWEEPLDRQPPKVRAAFEQVLAMKRVAPEIEKWTQSASAGNIYRMISGLPTKPGSPSITNEKAVSQALFAAGVAGSKYRAGQLSDAMPSGQFNYVVFDGAAVTIARMEQEGARGRIDFLADKRATITLFEGRDMSTLLHEGGHLWLEELRADALSLASGSVFADWETIKAWMKRETGLEIADDQPIPTEAHELWARGMERYFLEGKPPSEALRSPFASFRAWLLRIYKVVTGLRANIDDEVRQVFDRMLATDQAISLAQRASDDRPLFADAAAAGMTDAEFKAYSDLVAESRTEAYDRLLYKTMEKVRRERTAEHKERRARVRLRIEEEVKARPEWQAIDLLRGNGDTYMPVSKESVIQRVGNDAWRMLPMGRPGRPTFTDNGFDADLVAERAGFDSGKEMLEALMGIGVRRAELIAAGDRRTVLDETIDVLTDRELAENYGDPLADGSIEEEALEIIHTDAGAARLAAEVRQLAKQAGEAPTPEDAIRAWAERVVGEARIVDQASGTAVERHRRAEEKAGRAAEQAYLNGDFETAFREKQKQQIANALLRASRNARDRVEVIGRRLDRYSRSRGYKGMAPDYLDRIHELLEQFDLRRRSEKSLRERESFDRWAARQREMGIEVSVPERLTLAGDKHFTRLTFDEVVALDDTVESLANLGRQKTRLRLEQEERDLEALVGQAFDRAQALPSRPWDSERNRGRNIPREVNAALVKIEFVADYLDDGDPNGAFNEVLVKGATRAANKLEELQRDVMDPLAKLYLDLPAKEKRRFAERIAVPEFVSIDPESREAKPTTFLRSELIAVALNVGNRSNLEKMLEGETKAIEALLGERGAARHAWTEEKVMGVLNRHLSESDWQFVETVWDRVNSLWPEIVAAERELTGITPEKVIGRPVETRFGTIQGGYYPVVYDPNRSQMAADNADQEAADIFGAIGRHVGTPKGHTISRTSAAMPITFSLERVLFSHVKKVSTRIAYGRYVRDTMKFVSHPKVRRIFDEHLGMEYHEQLKPWLRDQVQDASLDLKHLSAIDRILRQFRVNMTLVGLGFRFTTMIAQIAGWHNSQAEIGTKWLLRGMKEMARNGGSIREFVFERSGEMMSRAQTFDRDIRLFYQQAAEGGRREGSKWMDKLGRAADAAGVPKLQAAAFWGIGMIDVYMVAMPTWLGAYYKALDAGMSEGEAAQAGDKAVRKSQSAGRMKDLAALQRGPEGLRVLTTFYSYFNILYNKQFETNTLVKRGRHAGRQGNKAVQFEHWRQAAMNVWWIMLIAPVTSALITGDLPDEEEDRDLEGWLAWAANRIFFGLWAGVPGVRDIASKWQRKIEGEYAGSIQSPFFTAFEQLERPLDDLFKTLQGDEPSDRWIRNAITAPGYFLGLPTGQVGATVQYLHDVATGDQEPEDAGDVIRGVAKGPQKDQE